MKILISDDEKSIRQSIKLILSDESYELIEASDLEQTLQQIEGQQPDLLLLDIHFKTAKGTNESSLTLMKRLVETGIRIPIIVLSGAATASDAAQAIKLGAYDFIEKPIAADRLRLTIQRCLENSTLKNSLQRLTVETNRSFDMIGSSNETKKIQRLMNQYAPKDVKVLITGETGVGKEVVAQGIWKASARASKPFIVVNSAAIPENLIESELFGHRKGSFTGAVADQVGKIEMADKGTLFLDEIGDLTAAAQTKLLRFLENGEIQKVGSNQIKKIDIRLIAATSRDLEAEIEKGHFRADLFYRLNVARIIVPALRDRLSDIPALFHFFVEGYCQKFNEKKKMVAPEVFDQLMQHDWPGNIRELRNVAERLVLAASGERILPEHVSQVLPQLGSRKKGKIATQKLMPLKDFKNQSEREYIETILTKAKGSITEAAKILKIDRTYLHQKMNHHGISKSRRD